MDKSSRSTASSRGPPEVVSHAPARVNLIGEHTDYCEGLVLPLPLPLRTDVELWRRSDRLVTASTLREARAEASYRIGEERPAHTWVDYVQGVTVALRRAGFVVEGVDLRIQSNIPAGAGLASSAALTVSLLRAFREAFQLSLDELALARLARAVETDFVGAPVGLMDPLAVSLGRAGFALFIDTRSLDMEHLSLPAGVEVGILHSGITHRNAGGTYTKRRHEAAAAALALGVPALRDVGEGDLVRVAKLPAPLDRRTRHVITENARVVSFVAALRGALSASLGALLAASHASLRDDYEVSHPDVDRLVALAQAEADVLGARMTGGGCGGAVLFLAREGRATGVGARLVQRYRTETGQPGVVLLPTPAA